MSFKESEIFVNNSDSGKAIIFYIGERGFTLAYSVLAKLKKGEYKAVKLTEIVKDAEPVENLHRDY